MSIKMKTSIIIFVSIILLCIAVYFISNTLLVGNALEQEKEITKQYLERIDNALQYKSRSLDSTMNDWADWDDTYFFVQDKNEEYIKSNLIGNTFINLKLNLMIIVDTNDNILYGNMMDLDNQELSEVTHSILEHLGKDSIIIRKREANKNFSGFLTLPEGIMLISSKAILKSDKSGPTAGTLIFGRFIDESEIKEIKELTGVPFSINNVNNIEIPPEIEKAGQTLGNGKQYYIQTVDDNQIAGYTVMTDIYGESKISIRINTNRDFYQRAKENTNFYIITLLLCAIAILVISIAIIEKSIIARLLKLNIFMTQISSEQDTSLRVQISGADEISNLAHEMNRMLEELNKSQEDNKRLLGEVMEYDELKNEFFSNISHEFRTPINVLLSTLQLIDLKQRNVQAGPNSYNIEKYIKIMKQNCYRLLRLASNIIDITKIDSGFFEINPSNCNVVSVIEEITMSVAEYIQGKGINLQFDTDVEEKIIAIDEDKIERIMLNLLSNAVKFTEAQGSIYVNVRDKGENVEISVKDTGIGIPKDKLPIIFERFRQVNSLLTRSHEGSGIGLSLVKNLVDLHGGSIRVESEYGAGTEFIFTLPVRTCSQETDQRLASSNSQGKGDRINIEFADTYSID